MKARLTLYTLPILVIATLLGCRRVSSTRAYTCCKNDLRQLASAKEVCAALHGWTNGTPCDTRDKRALINKHIKGGDPHHHICGVECSGRCSYTYNPVGVPPTCSFDSPDNPDGDEHRLSAEEYQKITQSAHRWLENANKTGGHIR
jgi:hypothetical protein